MKLNYSQANVLLAGEFELMNEILIKNAADYQNLPYCFYEDEFAPYILRNITENNDREIKKIFDFIERLMNSKDDELVNMVGVAVVESLYFDQICENYKSILLKYCGKETLQSFIDCLSDEERAEWEKPQVA